MAADGSSLTVRATVANTGGRDGADVVQVYATLPDPDAPARLVGFQRVEVRGGASADVTITVPLDRLATRDPERHAWRAPSGAHRITVARCAGDPTGRYHDVTL